MIIALAPNTVADTAANGPKNDVVVGTSPFSMTSSPNINGGLTMHVTPISDKMIVKILNNPHGSPRKIFENIATKTGVEKMITLESPNGIFLKA